ncbi:MAG: conjugal transfer protein TraF [Oligoflexia bacterium]|nr:conjugal transfer protein TraF [Oligoflexia bacterium]
MKRLVVVILLLATNSKAEDKSFFDDRERGWWWYEKIATAPKFEQKNGDKQAIPENLNLTPKQQLEAQGKAWEDAFAKSVVSPTEQNIKEYLYLTKKINEQAQKFSFAFKESIWVNPEFDYSLEKPVATQAIVTQNERDFTNVEKELKKIAKDYGLIFFFKGSCPHCHSFSPLLKKFAEHYEFTILPVTLDGESLAEFSKPKKNIFLGEKLNVSVVPALYLVHPDSNTISPISFGYTDWSNLMQKIITAVKRDTRMERR